MYSQRIIKFIGRLRPRLKLKRIYKNLITNDHQIILLDIPTNGNIGDQAIVYSTEKFLKNTFNGYSILKVSYTDVNALLWTLRKRLSKQQLVVLNGGGNLGDIYPSEEFNRWTSYKLLSRNNKLLFPQSISFKEPLISNRMLIDSKKEYRKAHNLDVFLREKASFNFFIDNYKDINAYLVPDIVFYLENNIDRNKLSLTKRDCISLLRNDVEKSSYDITEVYKVLSRKALQIHKSDTYISDLHVDDSNRENLVLDKLKEISQYKLVITDRLHGMILAYLAHTPAIIIENNNWKIKSTYETWLKDAPYIELISNNPDKEKAERKIDCVLNARTDYIKVSSNFDTLRKVVRDKVYEQN